MAPQVGKNLKVEGMFVGKKDGESGADLSGIACLPADAAATRKCVAINDENRAAQAVTIQPGGSLYIGEQIPLVGAGLPADVLGLPPKPPCPKIGKFGDLDGEGVATDGERFYVSGSHGCSRKKGEFRSASFLLARFRPDEPKRVELTFRLAEALGTAPKVGPYFGRDLSSANGLNVEGIAIEAGTLYAGLRAPSLSGRAFMVAAPVADLFASGDTPLASAPRLVEVELGENAGIRDLAALPDGRLLVLSGPAQEQGDVPSALWIVGTQGGKPSKPPVVLAPVFAADGSAGKAEAVMPLGVREGKLEVMVMFDGLPNGEPREYEVPIDE